MKLRIFGLFIGIIFSLVFVGADVKLVDGKLAYDLDSKGNRVLDFSYCGYARSEKPIPDFQFYTLGKKKSFTEESVSLARTGKKTNSNGLINSNISLPAVKISTVPGKDLTKLIQSAINQIELLPLNAQGFRGAVLLDSGVFTISSVLNIRKSGVILRGSGKDLTVLFKLGSDRFPFVNIEGVNNLEYSKPVQSLVEYLPVNTKKFNVANPGFEKGGEILILRPSTKKWIDRMGCNEFGGGLGYWGWKEGDVDLKWFREIESVDGSELSLDAPLTMAIDPSEGKLEIKSYVWKGRLENVGVENLSLVSDYDKSNPLDEDHAWTGISIDKARDCWVRQVNFKHLAGSAVVLQAMSSRITVEDCISEQPVSEIAGMRRSSFMTFGQLNLFQRCFSENGIHDFVAGYGAAGPNAFVQCESYKSLGYSGSVDMWAPGLLFDVVNIDGNSLIFKNLGIQRQGAGWNTANSVFWQCSAAEIECFTPDADNQNRAFGCWGMLSGNGKWSDANNHVEPRSLFYKQLEERVGENAFSQGRILMVSTDATSSPTEEQARELTDAAKLPLVTMKDWISRAPLLNTNFNSVKPISQHRALESKPVIENDNKPVDIYIQETSKVEIKAGKVVQNDALLVGSKMESAWWNGKLRPRNIQSANAHITRFVPDRFGKGLTDDIDSVVSEFKSTGLVMFDHHYSLWYDRRRDDHERVRRRDGDVWGPFYEQAFARSGSSEKAWDGLSLYDLNKPNKWYWSRLREFASKSEKEGIVLNEQHFFQHNIIEAGAHYVDSPWRTANNVNDMGLPEPINFAGDKRIFYAEMFYDLSYPGRKDAFRNYIRTCLDSLSDYSNVIHSISDEYTGPLHFVEFWIDVIAEWQNEKSKDVKVALAVTKDVQDAILKDPVRSKVIDIIDIRYWHPRNDGTIYAPEGGKNMAPRQFARKTKVGVTDYDNLYTTVLNYREMYPDKAVCYFGQNYPNLAWAIAMAGGSFAQLPVLDKEFLRTIVLASPVNENTGNFERLVKNDTENIIFSHQYQNLSLDLQRGKYSVKHINPYTGEIKVIHSSIKTVEKLNLNIEKGVYWVQKL